MGRQFLIILLSFLSSLLRLLWLVSVNLKALQTQMRNLDCLPPEKRPESEIEFNCQTIITRGFIFGEGPQHTEAFTISLHKFLKSSVNAGNLLEISKNKGVVESHGRLLPT